MPLRTPYTAEFIRILHGPFVKNPGYSFEVLPQDCSKGIFTQVPHHSENQIKRTQLLPSKVICSNGAIPFTAFRGNTHRLVTKQACHADGCAHNPEPMPLTRYTLACAFWRLCSASPKTRLRTPPEVTPKSLARGLTTGSVGHLSRLRAFAAPADVATKQVLSMDTLAPRSTRAVLRDRKSLRLARATSSAFLATASRLKSSTQTSKLVVAVFEVMLAATGCMMSFAMDGAAGQPANTPCEGCIAGANAPSACKKRGCRVNKPSLMEY